MNTPLVVPWHLGWLFSCSPHLGRALNLVVLMSCKSCEMSYEVSKIKPKGTTAMIQCDAEGGAQTGPYGQCVCGPPQPSVRQGGWRCCWLITCHCSCQPCLKQHRRGISGSLCVCHLRLPSSLLFSSFISLLTRHGESCSFCLVIKVQPWGSNLDAQETIDSSWSICPERAHVDPFPSAPSWGQYHILSASSLD